MKNFKTGIVTLRSFLHDQERGRSAASRFVSAWQQLFSCHEITDLQTEEFDFLIVLVLTGGTESQFLKILPQIRACGKPFMLAATESDNSLPASIEILTWLNAHFPGSGARIIHGSPEETARQLKEEIFLHQISFELRNKVAGIIGEPSEWLIASMPELATLEHRLGLKFVSIPMQQFHKYVDKGESSALSDFAKAFYRNSEKGRTSELARAASIYGGLMRVIKANRLDALTLRCFDILASDQTTGCLALAKLNDDGIPAACEGDVPAMLTMMVARAVSGKASFMANPSQIQPDMVTFAHCTCPPTILSSFSLDTHFESGKGLAVAGLFAEGEFTICKIDFSGGQYALATGRSRPISLSHSLCRTQIRLQIERAADYFFAAPLGNHHIIMTGNHFQILRRWCEMMQLKPVWQ